VWRGGERIVLPTIPGLSGITVRCINAAGWVAGFAGFLWTTTHAVVWRPVGATYQAIDLGTLPGTTISEAVAIDEQGRVVGWSPASLIAVGSEPSAKPEGGGGIETTLCGSPSRYHLLTVTTVPPGLMASGFSS
jgi:hypothetical protein